ncbi:MAG: hypothetical protein ACJ74T_12270 [Pyrinomonadaceae bacterium]
MDNEQFERHKEFMLQQQAQSAERIAQMEDLLVRFAQATRERLAINDQRAQELDEKLAALVDAQIRAEDRTTEIDREAKERAADFDRKIAALADAHMRTEEVIRRAGERIDNLTVVVERHIADGHGGRARPES